MSWLNKEEIVQLVTRVHKADSDSTCLLEADALKSRGKGIVDTVLEEIFRLKESGALARRDSFSLYYLLISIEPSVEPRHEKQIGEILLWDEVAVVHDGSTRSHLLNMLRMIGSAEMIPCLEELSMKVKGIVYGDDPELASPESTRKYNQEVIQATINAIRARVW